MKKSFPGFSSLFFFCTLVFFLLGPELGAQSPAVSGEVSFFQIYDFLQAQGPRPEGSPQEKASLDYLADLFQRQKIGVNRLDYLHLTTVHSFAPSLTLTFPGKLKDELLVVVPVDTEATHTNNAGIAWAAVWASRLAQVKSNNLTLTFLFLGAERGTGRNYPLGIQQFLSDYYPETPAAAICLDVDQASSSLQILIDSGAFIAPVWMAQTLMDSLQAGGFQVGLGGTHPQIFRFDLPEKRRIDHPFFQRDIPTVILANQPVGALATGDANLAQALTLFDGHLGQGIPQAWDRHYLFFDFYFKQVFLSQGTYLIILFTALAFLVVLFLWKSRALRDDLRSLVRSLWQLPIYFFFVFLFLVLGTVLVNGLLRLRGFDTFWQYGSLAVLLLKVTLSFGLYFLIFLQIRRMPLSRWPGFYSYASLIILGMDVFAAAALELSFSFYFLWALVFAFLFHFTKNRRLKILFFALAPLWFLKAVLEIFWLSPDPVLIKLITVSPLAGNLGLTLLIFPFILLSNSFHYLRHQRQERNEKHRAQLTYLFWFVCALGLGLFILRNNPFMGQKIPLGLKEVADLTTQDRILEIHSPVAWEASAIGWGQDRISLEKGKSTFLGKPTGPAPSLTKALHREAFLDRFIWTLQLDAPGSPQGLELTLVSDSSLVVYECNFPFQLDNTGHRARIFVGKNPPSHLEIKLTLAQQTQADLAIQVNYTTPPFPLTQEGGRFDLSPQLVVKDMVKLQL